MGWVELGLDGTDERNEYERDALAFTVLVAFYQFLVLRWSCFLKSSFVPFLPRECVCTSLYAVLLLTETKWYPTMRTMARQQTPLAKKVSWLSSIIYFQEEKKGNARSKLDDQVSMSECS